MSTVTVVIQTEGGTYTRVLTFDSPDKAEKARDALAAYIEKVYKP